MIYGDFNEILAGEEHSNYTDSPSTPLGMRDFQNVVPYCSILDLGYHGPWFTWCNKREEGLICQKLGRVLVNDKWLDKFPNSYCVFDSRGCSDHSRRRIMLEAKVIGKRKPFKLMNVLTNLP